MINFNLKYIIFAYLFLGIIIWIQKPKLIFDEQGNIRPFGVGKEKTIFYYPLLLIILACCIYFIFMSVFLKKNISL